LILNITKQKKNNRKFIRLDKYLICHVGESIYELKSKHLCNLFNIIFFAVLGVQM
jgi:hypothetical protein